MKLNNDLYKSIQALRARCLSFCLRFLQ